MHIILGSQSPRRREILSYFTIPFIQADPQYDEDLIPFTGDPVSYASLLAKGKSEALQKKYPDLVLITADTVVIHEGVSFGKPTDEQDAHRMLQTLCGKWHDVYTAVTIRKGKNAFTDCEKTRVLLNDLTPKQMHAYQRRCHSLDKAAGYAIQREGNIIVNRIEGCYYNVMGLPINTLRHLLLKVGVDLWDYIG